VAKAKVAVLKTNPQQVVIDYGKLMRAADYQDHISPERDLLIKLNLSWTRYFPACSSEPWQVEGVIETLLGDGFDHARLLPVENKTVVTEPRKGAHNNRWQAVLDRYELPFIALPEVEWTTYHGVDDLLCLNRIFPEGFEIPKMFIAKDVIHLPTLKTHGHSITSGAVKNAFGGLLKEVRHYAHKYIHELLVDLMIIQKRLHPGIFAVMDATVCGDGAGPRTMVPRLENYILASGDCVALDAVAAKLMGFDPMEIPYLRMCDERGLGVADLRDIEISGEDISEVNFGFHSKRSLVIWGDQMLRLGPLRFLEKVALHSPLVVWAPLASTIYHDWFWYPTVGRWRIRKFIKTPWGRLFQTY
jgi:uncharacterized protein (DUF362 family)